MRDNDGRHQPAICRLFAPQRDAGAAVGAGFDGNPGVANLGRRGCMHLRHRRSLRRGDRGRHRRECRVERLREDARHQEGASRSWASYGEVLRSTRRQRDSFPSQPSSTQDTLRAMRRDTSPDIALLTAL